MYWSHLIKLFHCLSFFNCLGISVAVVVIYFVFFFCKVFCCCLGLSYHFWYTPTEKRFWKCWKPFHCEDMHRQLTCLLIRPCFLLSLLRPADLLVLYVLWQTSYWRDIEVTADYSFLMSLLRYFSISLDPCAMFFTFLLYLIMMPSILICNGTRIFQKVFFNNFLYLYCAICSHCLLFSSHWVSLAL